MWDVIVEYMQEQLRRKERKHRDEFRKLMDEHKAAGNLTAKTLWRDYLMKVFVFSKICFDSIALHVLFCCHFR